MHKGSEIMAFIEENTLIKNICESDVQDKKKVIEIIKSTPIVTDPDYEGQELKD
mgnify:CR=1 FL=1